MSRDITTVPPAGFEPAPPPPEGGALSPELRGLGLHEVTSREPRAVTAVGSLALDELPVPRLGLAAAGAGPRRVVPAERRGVGEEPGPPAAARNVGSAADVDGQTPAVLARAGTGGEAGLARRHAVLRGERAVGVGEAQVGAEPSLVDLVEPHE